MRILLLVLSLASAAASAQGPAVWPLAEPAVFAVGVQTLAHSAVPPPLADAAGRSVRSVLTVGGVFNLEEAGVRAAFGRRPVTDAPWSFPVAVEASALLGGNGDGGFGLLVALGGAAHAARRLGSTTVYLQPGAQLSAGHETAYQAGGPFLGGRLSLDLIRYPTRRGLVAGVGVYTARRLGSDIYNSGAAGAAVTLGAQF